LLNGNVLPEGFDQEPFSKAFIVSAVEDAASNDAHEKLLAEQAVNVAVNMLVGGHHKVRTFAASCTFRHRDI